MPKTHNRCDRAEEGSAGIQARLVVAARVRERRASGCCAPVVGSLRSIPSTMRALDLFSGIGGFAIAGESVGIETAAFCEIEPFAVGILKKRFPGVPVFSDVRELGADSIGGIDIVCGGFPCQDLSVAGKRAGLAGERSGLWYEMLRIIAGVRPHYVLAENVRGAVNLALPTVVSGLEGEGYEVRASVVPASAFGAPHKRERLFVLGVRRDVADAVSEGLQGGEWGGTFSGQSTAAFEPAAECCKGKLWSTPDASCGKRGTLAEDNLQRRMERGMPLMLNDQVRMWRTPQASEGEHGGPNARDSAGGAHLSAQAHTASGGGQLSPLWCECLMNFPIGWTDPNCDAPEPWPGWPALMGEAQYPYEPPRTCGRTPNRAARLKCLGNAVVPAQVRPFLEGVVACDSQISSEVQTKQEEVYQ